MTRKNLLSPDIFQECADRINKLSPDTKPQWGKMSAAQMLAHCAEIQEVMIGRPLENTPLFGKMFKGFIRKMVTNDKPYPHNAQTHPQYRVRNDRDFETEKKRLLTVLKKLTELSEPERRQLNHALFGPMTDEEIGWSSYKHLDHHLTQFGV
jgi:hypothetical protein